MTRLENRVYKKLGMTICSTVLLFAVASSAAIAQNDDDQLQQALQDANIPQDIIARLSPDSKYRVGGTVHVRTERAEGWEWDHQVRIYLPPSYEATDKMYPTLWVTDNNLEMIQAALSGESLGFTQELIVVAIGPPADVNPAEFQRRRTYDFIPPTEELGPLLGMNPADSVGGAAGFLDFIANQLRPKLAEEYRLDLNDQGYAGHSGGAQFGLYVLLNKPESFHKYIISSPAAYQTWLDMEARYFEKNKDLNAKVFLSAGEEEFTHAIWSRSQIGSTVATMAERLSARAYPSLELTVRIFPGEDHLTVTPMAYTRGIRALWGNP